jgi:hypothetical protein
MLSELERKLTALVGDATTARAHLSVVSIADATAPDAGRGVCRVAVSALTTESGFERDALLLERGNGSATSRRVLPLGVRARLAFAVRPSADTAPQRAAARTLLLDDLSIVAHALAASDVRDGRAFRTAVPDPGFAVTAFALADGSLPGEAEGLFVAELGYLGSASVWPPAPPTEEGLVRTIDAIVNVLPLAIAADAAVVPTGGSTTLRIRGVGGLRLLDIDPETRAPLALAVTVVSDLPPAERGAITSGEAGVELGVRIVPVSDPVTVVAYRAPVGELGATRAEAVAVHLATPEGARGLFLGAAAVLLTQSEG